MARTLVPAEALDTAASMIKDMPLDELRVRVVRSVRNRMWMAAPWRWTVGSLPPVTLITDTQAYSVALPADYLFTVDAYLSNGTGVQRSPLRVVATLPAVVKQIGQIAEIAVSGTAGTTGTMRTYPQVGPVTGSPQIISRYKKTAPVLNESNVLAALDSGTSVLGFDDEWYWVFEAGILYYAYLYADDTRAGSVQFTGNQKQFTGQLAAFELGIQQMRENEPTINRQENPL